MSQQVDSQSTKILSGRKPSDQAAGIEAALVQGDLSKLSEPQRIQYYLKVCETVGLNPATKPFDYIQLNGKLVLYATKACAEQLRSTRGVSVQIKSRETVGDCYVVTASASLPDGRVDESLGAVPVGGLKGDNLCNALMKAETKAKRRVTLSICGLGMLDESELDTIKQHTKPAQQTPVNAPQAAPKAAPKAEVVKVEQRPVEAVVEEINKAEVAEAQAKPDMTEFHMQLIAGPYKGKLISELTLEQANEYLEYIKTHLESINRPASTLVGAHRNIYYTLVKYVDKRGKA